MTLALWAIIACGVLSIVYGIWAIQSVMSADAGNKRMQEIAGAIQEGATAYLSRQYTTIAIVGVVVFLLALWLLSIYAAIGFLIGAVLSGAAGFIGMHVSVRANVRTAQASSKGLAEGLEIAFKSGAITGMLVAGLALLGVSVYYYILTGPLGLDGHRDRGGEAAVEQSDRHGEDRDQRQHRHQAGQRLRVCRNVAPLGGHAARCGRTRLRRHSCLP